jgi:acetyltransferase-like isoleucine patch superfamily enzyme
MSINDKLPRATNERGELQGPDDWTLLPTRIGRGASLGSGAVIMGGVRVGSGAVIGAGAVVLEDVAPDAVVVGNPARVLVKAD